MACIVQCSDKSIDCSVRTLYRRSSILNELSKVAPSECEWCKPKLILPDCKATTVGHAVKCLEKSISPELIVSEEESRNIMECMEIFNIHWWILTWILLIRRLGRFR